MKQRSPVAVFFFPILTLGIYSLVWYVKTAGEMRSKGANIPTAWLIVVPFVNLYWIWKWCEGVGKCWKSYEQFFFSGCHVFGSFVPWTNWYGYRAIPS